MQRIAIIALTVLFASAAIGALVAPMNFQSRNIPEEWQPGRFEATPDGLALRELIERDCGEMPSTARLVSPMSPELVHSPDDYLACAAVVIEQKAPFFRGLVP